MSFCAFLALTLLSYNIVTSGSNAFICLIISTLVCFLYQCNLLTILQVYQGLGTCCIIMHVQCNTRNTMMSGGIINSIINLTAVPKCQEKYLAKTHLHPSEKNSWYNIWLIALVHCTVIHVASFLFLFTSSIFLLSPNLFS